MPIAFRRLAIGWGDFAIEGRAPDTAGLFEHHEFGRVCARWGKRQHERQRHKHRARQQEARNKFQDVRGGRQFYSLQALERRVK